MSSSNRKGGELSGSLLEVWNRPTVRYLTAAIAAVAGIGKLLEFLFQPAKLPGVARVGLWIALVLALLPFVIHSIARFSRRLQEDAIRQQICRGIITELVEDEETIGELAYACNAKLYGRAYEELIAHCTIREDGSAAFRRAVELVAHSPISSIDVYMLLPEAIRNGKTGLEPAKVKSLTPNKRITAEEKTRSSGKAYLRLHFAPELGQGQSIKYEIIEGSSPGLYAVTGREPRQMPYDYFAWDVTLPTKALEMKVLFPEGVHPRSFEPDVWHALGQGESTHSQEYNRVEKLLTERQEGAFCTLVFKVPQPILGLTYVICWKPPRAA